MHTLSIRLGRIVPLGGSGITNQRNTCNAYLSNGSIRHAVQKSPDDHEFEGVVLVVMSGQKKGIAHRCILLLIYTGRCDAEKTASTRVKVCGWAFLA